MLFSQFNQTTAGTEVLLETLSPSAVSSVTSGTLTAYDLYIVYFELVNNKATPEYTSMYFNGDTTAANYLIDYQNATIVNNDPNNLINLGSSDSTSSYVGQAIIGRSPKGSLNIHGVSVQCSYPAGIHGTSGRYKSASDISTISIKAQTSTITGKIRIYGRNLS
jgi:hypothetical protein